MRPRSKRLRRRSIIVSAPRWADGTPGGMATLRSPMLNGEIRLYPDEAQELAEWLGRYVKWIRSLENT